MTLESTDTGTLTLGGQNTSGTNVARRELVLDAERFYQRTAPITKQGRGRIFGCVTPSWRYPEGWQTVVRTGAGGVAALVVVHGFAKTPEEFQIPPPAPGPWQVDGFFGEEKLRLTIKDGKIIRHPAGEFSAGVLILKRT